MDVEMNERIQKLVEQATTKVEYYPPSCDGHTQYRYDFDKEKFAELIVEECSRITDDWVNDLDNGKNYPSERIKQHFGVER
jgi:hypothetical protein